MGVRQPGSALRLSSRLGASVSQLSQSVRRFWLRGGHKLDRIDIAAMARESWALGVPLASLADEVFRLLSHIINEGDCPLGACEGYLADSAALRHEERPCSACSRRIDLGETWKGPRVLLGAEEHCPACANVLDDDFAECAHCGHEPRGTSLARLLKVSTAAPSNDVEAAE